MIVGSWEGPIVVYGKPFIRKNDPGYADCHFSVDLELKGEDFTSLIKQRILRGESEQDQDDAVASYLCTVFCPMHRGKTLTQICDSTCSVCAPKARSWLEYVTPLAPEVWKEDLTL